MNFRNFLEKLQMEDEGTKKRILVVSSVVVMVLVFWIWLHYFDFLVGSSGTQTASDSSSGHGFSFTDTVRSGFGSMGGWIFDKVGGLGSVFSAPRSYIIRPPQ